MPPARPDLREPFTSGPRRPTPRVGIFRGALMRTPLLCALALLGCACAAHAQGGWPSQGYYPGYPAANGYPAMGWPNAQFARTGYPTGPQDFYYTGGQFQQAQFQPAPYQPPIMTTPDFDPSVDPSCS